MLDPGRVEYSGSGESGYSGYRVWGKGYNECGVRGGAYTVWEG
ncbi:unnamed protein product [Staurois parvus]|uniref:Uncharacterized protein n=1 Tax=Staurois parvus TaxID=386267 RepID=A0ABN9FV12_9NEOB|nr:unnamed protein product [Staurois parvus]